MRKPQNLSAAVRVALLLSLSLIVQAQEFPNFDRRSGIELFNQHRFREAVQSLQRALKKSSDDYEAWYYLGLALAKTNDLKNATKSIERALKLRPNSAEAHNGLAYIFLLRNKLADSISEAHVALNLDPQLAEPHYFIGVARLRMDARKEALDEAETAIKLNPRFPAAYLLKSQALVGFSGDAPVSDPKSPAETSRDRYREAATALEHYLQLNPDSENKETWVEQLESLKVYSAFHPSKGADAIRSGNEVAVKAKVLSKPEPGYTEVARKSGTTGTVVLKAVLAADGKVKHILVVKGLPDGLSETCIRAARAIKFIPATIDGKPVSQFIQLEYSFNLY